MRDGLGKNVVDDVVVDIRLSGKEVGTYMYDVRTGSGEGGKVAAVSFPSSAYGMGNMTSRARIRCGICTNTSNNIIWWIPKLIDIAMMTE